MMRKNSQTVIGLSLVCLIFFLLTIKGLAMELQLPPVPPNIEVLSHGKVKIGDLITKDNVDLVKEYLSAGFYQCVKDGMILRMSANNLPPEKMSPKAYLEATERNKDKAVMDDHGVVLLQDGSEWPGGIPYTNPKTGSEVMANMRFGHAFDDFELVDPLYYVNKNGEHYKTAVVRIYMYMPSGRVMVPPFGTESKSEGQHERHLNVFISPYELKGLGQFTIKYIDDTEKYDVGFVYLPAFKRTIRVCAATYQDNIGGSDFVYADPTGLREPYASWDFKLAGKKMMLVTEPVRENQAAISRDGLSVESHLEYDVGAKYARLGWTISPECIVEAIPKNKRHIYGKKVLYISAPYFGFNVPAAATQMDIYDRSGQLWKVNYEIRGTLHKNENGVQYVCSMGTVMYDLQSGHSSHFLHGYESIDRGMPSEFLSLKTLVRLGR